jgi:hypothetical protein
MVEPERPPAMRLAGPTVPPNLISPEQVVALTAGSMEVRLDVSQAAVVVQANDSPFTDRLTHKCIHRISIVYPAQPRGCLNTFRTFRCYRLAWTPSSIPCTCATASSMS